MSGRAVVVIAIVAIALGIVSAGAGAAYRRAVPRASAESGRAAPPTALIAGAPCSSIDAYYRTENPSAGGSGFVLLFTCSQAINGFTFTPGGVIPGAQLSYGTVITECYSSQGGGITNSPVSCAGTPPPIPANTRISVFYPSSETCPATGIHVVVTVDGASSFTVNGTCAGEGMGVSVKSLTGSPRGYRETLRCGADGGDCEAITAATDVGPKDRGLEVAYAQTPIASGATKTITVALKSVARSLLAEHHSLTAKVSVTGFTRTNSEPGPVQHVLSKTVRISSHA
jgi:hypothetical protein